MDKTIIKAIDAHADELIDLATKIWANPEMGWTEVKAVEWTAEVLKNNGFDVEVGAYGMPTAIRAVWGKGKPVVGFAGEYDCLPGLSQDVCSYQKPIVEGGIGHGCGHNLLGAGCVGACIGLKAALEEAGAEGTVIYYGCPAEEQLTGKGFMAKAGAFTECDFTYAWHPNNSNHSTMGIYTALEGGIFEFQGRTAHAAANPHLGRSALDAAQIMNIGVEFLREHVTDDVRMHYYYMDGGLAPNIVPEHAAVKYFVRALSRKATVDAFQRVMKCAEGAAHMTDTTLKFTSLGGIYPTMQNSVLGQAIQDARTLVPLEDFTDEEKKFADEINQKFPQYKAGETLPLDYEDETLLNYNVFGSTDYADVEHICPGFMVLECTESSLAPGHSWAVTAAVGSSIGMKGMIRAAKLMGIAAFDIMTHPDKLEAAKAEFAKSMGGEVYECPISEGVEWPYK